jgi:undecaprenyl-diphosphatase
MPYLLLLLGCVVFIFSILLLNIEQLQLLDQATVTWFGLHRTDILTQFGILLSHLGGMPFVLFLSTLWCICLAWYKKYTSAVFVCVGIFGGIPLAWLLKWSFARPRPNQSLHLVDSFGNSFPSAHSFYAACFACLVIYISLQSKRRHFWIGLAVLWMVVMGISRIYLGVHFPSDVLSGWSIGFIWISLLYVFWYRHSKTHK